ncbi:MAG TPA: DUF2155 domain-containing protein [Acetobacteraceae bacterium]|nr:DUF2155 domain-containing protein [Acetobacteraceae bacterium]
MTGPALLRLAGLGLAVLFFALPVQAQPIQTTPLPPIVPGQTLPAVPPPPSAAPAPQAAPTPSAAPPVVPVEAEWLPQNGVVLMALDKITARSQQLTGKVGDTLHFGTLAIVVRKCIIRPPDQPAGAAAYLDITDTAKGADPSTAFHGWMFSQFPALEMLQHPTYGIQVMGCTP